MLFSSGEICSIFNITKQRLLHYDKIGLLKPHTIDAKNGYRYYAVSQFPIIYLILNLADGRVPLNEIRTHIERRTPQNTMSLLDKHVQKVEQEISTLQEIHRRLVQQRLRVQDV
ncbi:MAG: MerR family DNA-binding transcriptional regulator, partial [Bacilli bacterium]